MYKKGGKKPKSNWMKESSEIKFGNGGLYSAAEKADNVAKLKKMHGMEGTKKKTGGADKPPFKFRTREEILNDKKRKVKEERESILKEIETFSDEDNIPGISGSSKYQLAQDRLGKLDKKDARYNRMLKKKADKKGEVWVKTGGVDKKKTGGKSMEPGGGGRFAAMVSNLKKKGKSEGSAKKIAAAIGRKKYGKSKFQEMAAKGKKGLGGMSDSTSANDAGMDMMETNMASDRGKKNASAEARKRGRKARRRQKRGKTGCWSGDCTGPETI